MLQSICNILLHIMQLQKGERIMATVYCALCIYLYQKGGVYYCGNRLCDLCGKSVTPDWGKSCIYYKGK